MQHLFSLLILICLLGFGNLANAGSSNGLVTEIMAHAGDVSMFSAGAHQGKPACSTQADQWALSLATSTGKAQYALLLYAQARGKALSVVGTNTCSAMADRESPLFIHLVE
jgi:hypothetical protein